jgi:class 3 adenylate cyclase
MGHTSGTGSVPTGADTHERRMVLTAVFVDIVGSTQKATALGDTRWRETLRSFERIVDADLVTHHGRKLFTKGDEIVATFRSPARAIAYSRALRDDIRALDLEIRAGIHTGEIEGRHTDLSGIALHIGQRVSASASPGEILVSSTVRDLALGSGVEFIDRGEHELQGLPGSWRLYAVGDNQGRP